MAQSDSNTPALSVITKGDVGHIETGDIKEIVDVQDGLGGHNVPHYSDAETTKLLHKIDWRLLPMLTLLYAISALDKGNVGNAKVAGMNTDLGLTSKQYNIVLTLFFIPYALLEIPSNIMLKIMRPSIWIAILMVAWGSTVIGSGFATGYHSLLASRVILGACEAGFFPAAGYLVGDWYCRFEIQWRMSLFFSAASISGAFSGLLAFALEKMDGVANLEGWRWIFIIEGLLTAVIGLTVPWALPDSPASASFLTPEEKRFIKERLERDSGTSAGRVQTAEGFQWTFIKAALADWKIWFTIFIYWGNTVVVYGFTYAAPTIVLELGYTKAQAQLLTIPIYTVALLATLGFSWIADRRRRRWPFIVIPYAISLAGSIALIATPSDKYPGVTYAFLFAIPAGVYPAVISLVTWVSNNLSPTWKRSTGIAMSIMLGNLGGAVGSNIYMAQEAPRYKTGYAVSIAVLSLAIVCTMVLRFTYDRINKQRDRIPEEEVRAKYTEQELLDLGDRSPLYRYVL